VPIITNVVSPAQANKCDCGIHGKGCDVSTGACFCKPGFTGGKSQIGLVYGV
jgi:hypothetical protein